MATTTLLDDDDKVEESGGFCLPGEEIRIAGSEGKELPPGHTGELQIRGASLFVGYLKKRPKLYDLDTDG